MPRNTNIKKVAKNVIKQVASGNRPNVKEAMIEAGYSLSSAGANQGRITKNKAYIKEVEKFDDVLDGLILDAVDNLKEKKDQASYRDSLDGVYKLKKLQRLLNGESTENIANSISGLLDSLE